MTDEDLIEKAARAAYAAVYGYEPQAFDPGEGHDEDWRAIARAALAVFKKAHGATDDEREALVGILHRAVHPHSAVHPHVRLVDLTEDELGDTYLRADAILAAGFRRAALDKEGSDET
jgi:hypothetical protein